MRTLAGDEVYIFNDHQGRLQKARQAEIFANQADLLRGDQQSRVVFEL